MQSRTICLRLKVPYFWMWYRVFW